MKKKKGINRPESQQAFFFFPSSTHNAQKKKGGKKKENKRKKKTAPPLAHALLRPRDPGPGGGRLPMTTTASPSAAIHSMPE